MASNPLLKFRDEILSKVVYPKLYGILTMNKGDISINDLWKEFRKLFECSVSLREFKEWCGEMGLHQEQVIRWDMPPTQQVNQEPKGYIPRSMDKPTLMKIEEMNYKANREEVSSPTDPDINFDNE